MEFPLIGWAIKYSFYANDSASVSSATWALKHSDRLFTFLVPGLSWRHKHVLRRDLMTSMVMMTVTMITSMMTTTMITMTMTMLEHLF